jgi:hypothetical protein
VELLDAKDSPDFANLRPSACPPGEGQRGRQVCRVIGAVAVVLEGEPAGAAVGVGAAALFGADAVREKGVAEYAARRGAVRCCRGVATAPFCRRDP